MAGFEASPNGRFWVSPEASITQAEILHGLTLLRSLKPRQKARVKALRAAKGVRPAIAFARRLAKR
jgi:hypothetical protein